MKLFLRTDDMKTFEQNKRKVDGEVRERKVLPGRISAILWKSPVKKYSLERDKSISMT